MNEITINLSEEYGVSLESKELAIEIFEKIPKDVDKVIFNFYKVFEIGCFFAKEFLNLKQESNFIIEYELIPSHVDATLKLVSRCKSDLADGEFIAFLKDNTCQVKINYDELK